MYNNFIDFLKIYGSITMSKALIHSIGLKESILFCELLSKGQHHYNNNTLDSEFYFHCTQYSLQASTGINDRDQRKAIKKLNDLGLIHSINKGMPAKRHFKITITPEIYFKLTKEGKEILKELEDKDIKCINSEII